MGTELLRSHGGPRGRPPAGDPSSSTPAKPFLSPNPSRHMRTSRRPADYGSTAARSPPSQTKRFGKNAGDHSTPVRYGRRSRTPESEGQMVVKAPVRHLVMEEVTILKRGEEARSNRPAEDSRPSDREATAAADEGAGGDEIALCSTKRLGPDPEILPRQMRLVDRKNSLYAGSGFFMSPSPRSLPLPTFFEKKEVAGTTDLATRGLRYLLRLDLP